MQLNLPAFDVLIRREAGGLLQIYDRLRDKYVALTPEEWVRQHFVNFLIEHKRYPASLMANEVGLKQNGCRRRCDTIVYDRCARPVAIVEYKSPEIAITNRVFDQIVRYNMVLNVGVLMVSNGLSHYCCRCLPQEDKYVFLREVPAWEQL